MDFSTWGYLKRLKNEQLPGAVAQTRAEIINITMAIWNDDITQDMINEVCGNGSYHRLTRCVFARGHSSESLAHLERCRDSIDDLPVGMEEY